MPDRHRIEISPGFSLDELTDHLIEAAMEGERVTVGRVLEAMGRQGLSAMLILPSLLVSLPIGAIPLFPAVMGLVMIFIALHLLIGRQRLWLPQRLSGFAFSAEKLGRSASWFKPWASWLDGFLNENLAWLVRLPFSQQIIAVLVVMHSLAMIVIGALPFAPAVFGLAILPLALGLAAGNGIILGLGYIINAAYAVAAVYLLPW